MDIVIHAGVSEIHVGDVAARAGLGLDRPAQTAGDVKIDGAPDIGRYRWARNRIEQHQQRDRDARGA
jgi:hypothetical protein